MTVSSGTTCWRTSKAPSGCTSTASGTRSSNTGRDAVALARSHGTPASGFCSSVTTISTGDFASGRGFAPSPQVIGPTSMLMSKKSSEIDAVP